MKQTAIEVKELSVKVGGHQVIDNASFGIPKGSFTYIIGANGSGKTILIRAMLGLIEPNAGSITVFGKPLTQQLIAEVIGYLPQYSSIDRSFPITVEEMINLECDSGRTCAIGVTGHLKLVFDAEHLEKRRLSNLSGGEFQKVLIARALVNDPEVLILDEPINNLDRSSQEDLLMQLKKIHMEQKKTVLIISHDHHIIDQGSDHILYLKDHQVISGRAGEVLRKHHLHLANEHS